MTVGIDLSFWLLTVNIYAFDGWRWYFKSFDGWLLKSTGTLLCSQMDYRFSSIKFSPSENRFLTFVSFSPYLPISSIVNNNKNNGNDKDSIHFKIGVLSLPFWSRWHWSQDRKLPILVKLKWVPFSALSFPTLASNHFSN